MDTDGDELTTDHQLVIQAIYNHFNTRGNWPSFIEIDRPLRRTHELNTQAVLRSLPDELIVKPRGSLPYGATDELRLRLRGIHSSEGSAEDIERFIQLLRWLARKETEFDPEPGSPETTPVVTSEEVREHLSLPAEDQVALQRLYAMLYLDNWGLAGSGSNAAGWQVSVGPEIWRFRDVRTVDDCIRVRANWIAEAQASASWTRTTVPTPEYFHVRLTPKSHHRDEVRLDLTREELRLRFLLPRTEGHPIVINGKTIPIEDVEALRISRTDQPSEQLRPAARAERLDRARQGGVVGGASEDWRVAKSGKDVTEEFITEPPGSATVSPPAGPFATASGAVDNQLSGTAQGHVIQAHSVHGGVHYYSGSPLLPASPAPSKLYVDRAIIDAIQAKREVSVFNVDKLLELIRELNESYEKQNTYTAHTSLRAILDHVPPILGCADFKGVASNYRWGRTDKSYMKLLLDFKLQANDALHRQISEQADLLKFEHLPSNLYVNHLLQECADKL